MKKNRWGSIVLDTNERITKKEQSEFKKFVKRANQRRYDRVSSLYKEVKNNKNMKGISLDAYSQLIQKTGFITEKYSSAFKQFKNKNEFKELMKELKTVTKKGYGNNNIEKAKQIMVKRAYENYGEQATPIIDKLNTLTRGQLVSVYMVNDEIIRNLYGSPPVSADEIDEFVSETVAKLDYYTRG